MYVKLFAKILDSSVWEESAPTKVVWITMLASMDADGFCQFATVETLARRAKQKPCHVREAIAILEAPDKNSSTPSDDGRRIERVPGGWYVINAKKYREISAAGELRKTRRNPSQLVTTRNNLSQLVTSFPVTTNGINKSLPEVEVEVDIKNKYKVADAPIFVLPVWIDSEVWRDFEEMRTKIRKKLTDGARRRIVAKLEAYRTASFDPNSILGTSIENGWAGVFEPKSFYGGTNGQNQRNGNASLGKQADRNAANRDAILAGIFGGNAGGNAAHGGGAGEDQSHPGGIGNVGKAGPKLLT